MRQIRGFPQLPVPGLALLETLYDLPDLVEFDLSNNQLEGQISAKIVFLSETLEALDLSRNKLTGNLPHQLGALTMLRELQLQGNSIEGTISTDWGEM